MKVALLFGSFNPIHKGHLALADWVLCEGLADAVWLVVSPQNPMKQLCELAPFEDRVAMACLAVGDRVGVRVETIEDELSRPSYTYNTIVELKRKFADTDFVILAGSDVARGLSGWYRSDELRAMVDFLFYPRGEGDVECSDVMRAAPRWDVSATLIREGKGREFVERRVWRYVVLNNLYDMKTIENLSELIATEVDDKILAKLYFERGKAYYAANDFGKAINDFRKALEYNGEMIEASEMIGMCNSILDYRYTDIYNP